MDINSIFDRTAQGISDAIKGAAQATGASFEYLLATARAESGLNPQAAATTSTARGLYQFVDQTWLGTMKKSGASLGYGRYADAISETAAGHYDVADPAMRRDILALRDDPTANAALAAALTRDNAAMLAGRLGRKATDGEVYLAHVLGAAGAAKLATLTAASPGAAADAAFPAAAAANRAIFYDRQGRARNVADVYGVLIGRYDGARAGGPDLPDAAGGTATAIRTGTPPAGDPLPLASASFAAAVSPSPAAQSGPLFSGLFSDGGGPGAQGTQNLWSDPVPVPGPAAPAGAAPAAGVPATASPLRGASLVAGGGARSIYQDVPAHAGGLFGP